MTFFERSVVRSGHPRRIIVGVITLMWVLYSLWFHLWAWATVAVVAGVALGALATKGMLVDELAQTVLGKVLLLHLHPVNVALQTFGFAVLLYSFWIHSAVLMLLAISVILLGHRLGRKEPNMMIIGVDYHPSFQTIAFLIEESGNRTNQVLGYFKWTITA